MIINGTPVVESPNSEAVHRVARTGFTFQDLDRDLESRLVRT
jgi:hypothetical protein